MNEMRNEIYNVPTSQVELSCPVIFAILILDPFPVPYIVLCGRGKSRRGNIDIALIILDKPASNSK